VTASKGIMGISRLPLRNSISTFIHAFTSFLLKRRELSQATIKYDTNRHLHFLRDFCRNSCVFKGSGNCYLGPHGGLLHIQSCRTRYDVLSVPKSNSVHFSTNAKSMYRSLICSDNQPKVDTMVSTFTTFFNLHFTFS